MALRLADKTDKGSPDVSPKFWTITVGCWTSDGNWLPCGGAVILRPSGCPFVGHHGYCVGAAGCSRWLPPGHTHEVAAVSLLVEEMTQSDKAQIGSVKFMCHLLQWLI